MAPEQLLDKLAKLKRHADSAKAIGSLAEAETFAAKFQQLLLQHKLEATDIELEQQERAEPVGHHRIDYSKYPDVKVRNARVQWIERLASIVARAHFCRILIHHGSSRITLVGRKSDAAVAEYMLVTLQRAAERLADAAYAEFTVECVKECAVCGRDKGSHFHAGHQFVPNWARARGYRGAFIQSFIIRLHERFQAERRAAETSTSTALVRLNTADQAVETFMAKGKYEKASALSRPVSSNQEGHRDGRAAADRVNIKANAVGTSAGNRQLED